MVVLCNPQRMARDILLSGVKRRCLKSSHRYEEVWHLDISSLLTGCLVVRRFEFRDPPFPASEDTVAALLLPQRMVKSLRAPSNVRLRVPHLGGCSWCSMMGLAGMRWGHCCPWRMQKRMSGGFPVIIAPRGAFSLWFEGLRAKSSAAMERKSESLRGSGEVSTDSTTVTGLLRVENNLITKKNWTD